MAISVERVMHVNVNCSNLERSLGFYRDVVGLVPASHTNPVPQDGAGFDMPGQVQWDAHILQDFRGFAGPAIDLLEWKRPGPTGHPPSEPNHLGLARVCLSVPDLDAVFERAVSAGAAWVTPPVEVPVEPDRGSSRRVFLCRDPDGTAIEFVEQASVSQAQLAHVNLNCSNLARSLDWYQRVLGLELRGSSRSGPLSGAAFGLDGEVEWDARFLWPPGQDAFAIDLLEWKSPKPVGKPAGAANQRGLYRMAFMVEDIHVCHEELKAQGVDSGRPVFLDMGPEIPIDGVWAVFFRDPDGSCMELIETPSFDAPS
jgi:catechol 2,3-dioxygenase-like lactoylglutathione lyase family enzyme